MNEQKKDELTNSTAWPLQVTEMCEVHRNKLKKDERRRLTYSAAMQ